VSEPLRIAFDRLNPPFATVRDWESSGFTVAVVRAAYEHAGMAVEAVGLDGPMAQLMWLAAGRVDGAADITDTARRRAWFVFSTYYHIEELMVFGRRDGPIWSGFRHFRGIVAVKANSYVQEYLIRHQPELRRLEVDSTEAQLEAVLQGRAQVFAATRETGMALIRAGEAPDILAEGVPFGPAPLALAAMPDDAERVIAPFNAGLDALHLSGGLERLRQQWFQGLAHA
jgi:ABC-type amino acid transport substrate-binding protein